MTTRAAFESIVDAATALVRPWPVSFAHEIDALNRPVVNPATTRVDLLAAVRLTLEAGAAAEPVQPTLRAEQVLSTLD